MKNAVLSSSQILRLRIVAGVLLLFLIFLLFMIWRVQIQHSQRYAENQSKQSVRRVRLPGVRGVIYDRHGEKLADNRPDYCLAFYLEELRERGAWSNTVLKVERLKADLEKIIGRPSQLRREDIWAHIRKRLPLPLVAWRGLSEQEIARWSELAPDRPGVDIYLETARFYPCFGLAAHILGYVGKADDKKESDDEDERYHYYLPEMEGKSGIEKRYDKVLRGDAGGQLVQIDVTGFRRNELVQREPNVGRDVVLSLDKHIQQSAEEVLTNLCAAVVVMDPRNGDVLAMASSPSFDSNIFVPTISRSNWLALVNDPRRPLLDRAINGLYAPGSIFKPAVMMAALEGGHVNSDLVVYCPGRFQLGKHVFRCHLHSGHGSVNFQQTLALSCDVFMYRLGLICGHEPIAAMARALNMGRKTGIDLDYEAAGIVPDDAWKRRRFHEGWRDGDTCNYSIGQGFLTVTPLQMAVMTCALANGGIVNRPRLVLGVRDNNGHTEDVPVKVTTNLHWSPRYLSIVRAGMYDVVMSSHGTGRQAAVPGVPVAGKTGTAEYGRKGEGHKFGWMIAYAPANNPRYAVALVVEEAVGGGATAGPLLRRLLTNIFKIDGTLKAVDG